MKDHFTQLKNVTFILHTLESVVLSFYVFEKYIFHPSYISKCCFSYLKNITFILHILANVVSAFYCAETSSGILLLSVVPLPPLCRVSLSFMLASKKYANETLQKRSK